MIDGLKLEATSEVDEVENKIKLIKDLIVRCKSKLAEASDLELISFQSECTNVTNLDQKQISLPDRNVFRPSTYKLPALQELVGCVVKANELPSADDDFSSDSVPCFDISMIQVRPLTTISILRPRALIHNSRGEAVIFDLDNDNLTLFDENFKKVKTIDIKFQVRDMALAASGDIIATDLNNNRIVKITPSGRIITFHKVPMPQCPFGICINNRQQIVVGQQISTNDYNDDYSEVSKLVIYSPDGSRIEGEIWKDENAKPLFPYVIHQVKQGKNGDYVVSLEQTIVCASSEGKRRWERTVSHIGEEDLRVFGLVCDKFDNIIISDYDNCQIYVLDSEGEFITSLCADDDNIGGPISLSLDKHGYLWIGQERDITVWKYIK